MLLRSCHAALCTSWTDLDALLLPHISPPAEAKTEEYQPRQIFSFANLLGTTVSIRRYRRAKSGSAATIFILNARMPLPSDSIPDQHIGNVSANAGNVFAGRFRDVIINSTKDSSLQTTRLSHRLRCYLRT